MKSHATQSIDRSQPAYVRSAVVCIHRQTAQRLFCAHCEKFLTVGIQFLTSGKIPKRSLGPLPMDAKKRFDTRERVAPNAAAGTQLGDGCGACWVTRTGHRARPTRVCKAVALAAHAARARRSAPGGRAVAALRAAHILRKRGARPFAACAAAEQRHQAHPLCAKRSGAARRCIVRTARYLHGAAWRVHGRRGHECREHIHGLHQCIGAPGLAGPA